MKKIFIYGIPALIILFAVVGSRSCQEDNGSVPTSGSEPAIVVEDVRITCIFFNGQVPYTEADEYVEITNVGDEPQELTGCVLMDIEETYQRFVFPYFILEPDQSVCVYTDEIHPEWGGFSFESPTAIWNNKDHDTAVLLDSQGNELSRMSY